MPSPLTAHTQALSPGSTLDVFEIKQVIGVGGFGVTYEADDTSLDRKVAIKEYFPQGLASRGEDGRTLSARGSEAENFFGYGLKRFLDEARILAQFHHPNIVRVNRYLEAHGTAYLIMDYEDGQTLRDYLWEHGSMAEEAVQRVTISVLAGLAAVHARRYLHRDIKPDNIFLRQQGQPLLLDFGSARQALEHERQSMTVLLTPGYAPIEQYAAQDEQGPYSDLYAVGATMFRCLAGKSPPEATTRVLALHSGAPDPLQADLEAMSTLVEPRLLGVVQWLLSPQAGDRPQSAHSVLSALERLTTRPMAEEPASGESVTQGFSEMSREGAAPLPDRRPPAASPPPAAPAPPATGAVPPAAPRLGEGATQEVEDLLAEYIGPIAKLLVKRVVESSRDRGDLVRGLADEIDDATERTEFLERLARVLPPL